MPAPKGNKNALGNAGGRPTAYQKGHAKAAAELCRLGATDADLARAFNVTVSTIALWKVRHVEFSDALKVGKEAADNRVEASLYHRATGYSHPAVKIMAVEGVIKREEYTEHYPPDSTSMIFWLKNRRPGEWRDKSEVEITDVAARLDAARKRAIARKG